LFGTLAAIAIDGFSRAKFSRAKFSRVKRATQPCTLRD
jgi:hypothetical protein